MARFIGKLKHPKTKKVYYFEWSTIVDAPCTYMMSFEEFLEWYRAEYGDRGMRDLQERLERVERNGTSEFGLKPSYKDFISYNRAGENESRIKTISKMIEYYLPEQKEGGEG